MSNTERNILAAKTQQAATLLRAWLDSRNVQPTEEDVGYKALEYARTYFPEIASFSDPIVCDIITRARAIVKDH